MADSNTPISLSDALITITGRENVKLKEPLSRHTTLRIGGPADFFVEPQNENQLQKVLTLCRRSGAEWFLIGNGSNLLVPDIGFHGVVVSLQKHMGAVTVDGSGITVQAGALLSVLAKAAADYSLEGLAFASGIPGTVGGAIMMNAGAYGGEIGQICDQVRVLEPDGTIHTYQNKEMQFSYRHSRLMESSGIVVSAHFQLKPGNQEQIRSMMADYNSRRREKQPLEYPSAGSTFKRPPGHYAAKLIEDAGLKGYRVGGIEVSEKHSGFVVNKNHGTAEDMIALMEHVKMTVREKFGVALEPEVQILPGGIKQ